MSNPKNMVKIERMKFIRSGRGILRQLRDMGYVKDDSDASLDEFIQKLLAIKHARASHVPDGTIEIWFPSQRAKEEFVGFVERMDRVKIQRKPKASLH